MVLVVLSDILKKKSFKENKFLKFSLVLLVVLVILDQYIKFNVTNKIELGKGYSIIGEILMIKYVRNYGAAFSLLLNKTKFLIFFTFFIILIFIVFLIKRKIEDRIKIFSATIIIAGGIGNLIDRLFRGYVVDYVNFNFFPSIFNFADCLVVVGSLLFLLRFIKSEFFSNNLKKH